MADLDEPVVAVNEEHLRLVGLSLIVHARGGRMIAASPGELSPAAAALTQTMPERDTM